MTEQFLEIHDVERIDGVPRLERVDRDKSDGVVTMIIHNGNTMLGGPHIDKLHEI